jgi:hypothetical protein
MFHEAVRKGLEKDGWKITDDPLWLKQDRQPIFIDLAAERLLQAERGAEKIAVEIKTFAGRSFIDDWPDAAGQFINYRSVLRRQQPERKLYLAVPQETYDELFQDGVAPISIEDNAISLLVYNATTEEIVAWKP